MFEPLSTAIMTFLAEHILVEIARRVRDIIVLCCVKWLILTIKWIYKLYIRINK